MTRIGSFSPINLSQWSHLTGGMSDYFRVKDEMKVSPAIAGSSGQRSSEAITRWRWIDAVPESRQPSSEARTRPRCEGSTSAQAPNSPRASR